MTGFSHGIRRELNADAFVVRHCETAGVTGDAGLYLIHAPLAHLGYYLIVREELASDADAVYPACGNSLGGGVYLHASGAVYRLGSELLYMLNIAEIAVERHVYRRVRPVPCVVCAVIAGEHVIARVFEVLYRALGLRHIAANLGKYLAGNSTLTEALCLADDAVPQGYGEVLSAELLYLLHDLNGETVAVLKAAAVFVGAVVGVGHGELIHQISLVYCVHLHAVYTGILCEQNSLRIRLNVLMYLLTGQLAAFVFRQPHIRRAFVRRDHERIHVEKRFHYRADELVVEHFAERAAKNEGASLACGNL